MMVALTVFAMAFAALAVLFAVEGAWYWAVFCSVMLALVIAAAATMPERGR